MPNFEDQDQVDALPADDENRAAPDAEPADAEVRGAAVAPDADPQELLIDTHVAQDEPDLDGDGKPDEQ